MLKCDYLLVLKLFVSQLHIHPWLYDAGGETLQTRFGSEISGLMLEGACKSRGGKGTNSFLFAPTGLRSVCHG